VFRKGQQMPKKEKAPTEDRDQQILRRLSNIEHKVDSLEQTTAFAFRADSERHYESVKKIFQSSRRRVQVYLAANGRRSVNDIAALLRMKKQNVSRELDKLRSEGLLEIIEKEGNRVYWDKKPLDRTVRISTLLMGEYGLTKDGLSTD
jgi:DNA-binding transcriptional ArsR family regulator